MVDDFINLHDIACYLLDVELIDFLNKLIHFARGSVFRSATHSFRYDNRYFESCQQADPTYLE